jgi:hypothetical protein
MKSWRKVGRFVVCTANENIDHPEDLDILCGRLRRSLKHFIHLRVFGSDYGFRRAS